MSHPPSSVRGASSRTAPAETARDLARCAQPHAARGDVRVARLSEAIRRTRAELDACERRCGEIGERFVSTIRPREEHFTRAVCRVTERLVTHHEDTLLAGDERTLLGLWINENLQSLAGHPFAPRGETDTLARRWRRHLGMAEHPLDVPLASLYARQAGAPRSTPSTAGEAVGEGDPTREGHTRGEPGGDRQPGDRASAANGTNRAGNRPADEGVDAEPDGAERELRRLLARLFRRLARVLHPDREPDEARKRDKHRLMSDCLRARDERDIDTLLSLYTEHVGGLPMGLADADAASLERLLRVQLDTLQRRLRQRHFGDALQRMIVERYGGDRVESDRRFADHARALDGETRRFEGLERLVEGVEGLRQALAERRELELDRLSIDELTGTTRD